MPRPRRRLIPILLLDRRRRLVKTVGFGERTYIGDPFNVVRLFNEKEVDELCLLDIDATVDQRAPDAGFLGELASECFMPLTYGGGITGVEQCRKLSRAGIEKFVVGTASLDDTVMRSIAKELGSQALVACVDVKGSGDAARCVVRSGKSVSGYRSDEPRIASPKRRGRRDPATVGRSRWRKERHGYRADSASQLQRLVADDCCRRGGRANALGRGACRRRVGGSLRQRLLFHRSLACGAHLVS